MTLKEIDFGSFSAPVRQQPAAAVVPSPPPDRRNWIVIILVVVIVFMMFFMFGRTINPIDDRADVKVDGKYVLFLKDESRPDSMTIDQGTVMNSAKVAKWCESNGVEMRVLDSRDNTVDLMEPVWGEVKKVADPVPSMTTLKDRKAVTEPVPSSVDETIRLLEQRFK